MQKGTNGKIVGKNNADKLKVWLDQQTSLPGHGGEPNKSEIARLAGLKDRQPFRNNAECKRLLAEAVKKLPVVASEGFDDEKSRLEKLIKETETCIDGDIADNFELNRKLKKLQHIEHLIESGKRFIS